MASIRPINVQRNKVYKYLLLLFILPVKSTLEHEAKAISLCSNFPEINRKIAKADTVDF